MDCQAVALVNVLFGASHMIHRDAGSEFACPVAKEYSSQKYFTAGRKQKYPHILASYEDLPHAHLDPALSVSGL